MVDNYNIEELNDQDLELLDRLKNKYKQRKTKFTKEELNFIKNKLSNRYWRLNNLYYIRDKAGRLRLLTFNFAQRVVWKVNHNRKIILKSRQQGISTQFLAINLDKCLFTAGYSAGIQSYGLDEANKLQQRAELMWDMLNPKIKKLMGLDLVTNNQKGMMFSNGSILKIGNFRGDTLQSLHISELAKIAAKYPDKAKELKTGAFQAVATDNDITIESTAEGAFGMFFDMWNKAERKADLKREFTPLDFYPIFLSWVDDPDCTMSLEKPLEETEEYLDYVKMVKKEAPNITFTEEQRNWLIAKLEELGEDFNREYPITPSVAFKQSVEGAYFGKAYKRLISENRIIKANLYDPSRPVYVASDLGVNDEFVFLFCQVNEYKRPILIGEYINSGEGIEFYMHILRGLQDKYKWKYAQFFMPHDAEVRELGTGKTRTETFKQFGMTNIRLLKRLPFKESINIARGFLDIVTIQENKCPKTIDAIQNYRRKYDNKLGVFLETDVHDENSNLAAALRYMAQGLGFNINTSHYKKQQREKAKNERKQRYQRHKKGVKSYSVL